MNGSKSVPPAKVSSSQEKRDLDKAFQSSNGFANPYGEEEYSEQILEEKLSETDGEFDFALQIFDRKNPISDAKKSIKNPPEA